MRCSRYYKFSLKKNILIGIFFIKMKKKWMNKKVRHWLNFVFLFSLNHYSFLRIFFLFIVVVLYLMNYTTNKNNIFNVKNIYELEKTIFWKTMHYFSIIVFFIWMPMFIIIWLNKNISKNIIKPGQVHDLSYGLGGLNRFYPGQFKILSFQYF